MRNPRRPLPIRRPSWLDQWVYRFQHRWETNAQYRAAVSGVCGLVLIVLMCSCTGLLATVANASLAGLGGGGANGSGNSNTGTKQLGSQQSFPTSTIPPYTVATIPSGNIPDSQTPPPGPTATPTDLPATPTDTPSGGGGPPPPTTCNGGNGPGSWAFTPCPMVHGQSVTLTVSYAKYAGHGMYVVVNFGTCNNCTWLLYPSLDSSGNWSYTGTVPAGAANSTVPVGGEININNGPVMGINAAPVQ